MIFYDDRSTCEGTPGHIICSRYRRPRNFHRVEILAFIDPLCAECWGLEPLMKKFFLEYHDYFTFRFILTTKHDTENCCQFNQARKIAEEWDKYAHLTGMCCDSDVWFENPPSPYAVALSIKAAEFQGKAAGNRFLRRIREQIFFRKKGMNQLRELLEVARLAKLDIDEFNSDFHSCRSIKSLQCDRRLANEMAITELPSLVFSTADGDSEAVKVNGRYAYDVYVQILTELLGDTPVASPPPSLKEYFRQQSFLATKEVSVVYDLSEEDALKELRKLQLQQLIEPIVLRSGTYWKYIAD